MKVINENKRLLFTLKEKTSGLLVVAPEELVLVDEALNQATGGGGSETQHSYSKDETLTGGTWIDGKPIYRKVLTGEHNGTNVTAMTINYELNLSEIINVYGHNRQSIDDVHYPIGFCQGENGVTSNFRNDRTELAYISFYSKASGIITHLPGEYFIILEYTKNN